MTGVDTNVLIYACDKGEPTKQKKALTLISSLTDGVLLWQVACEFVAASRKLADQGFSPAAAWDRLSEYLALFPLVLPTARIFDTARTLHVDKQFSFWDGLIIGACRDCGVTLLYSEDLPGSDVDGLEIVNPFLWARLRRRARGDPLRRRQREPRAAPSRRHRGARGDQVLNGSPPRIALLSRGCLRGGREGRCGTAAMSL